MAISEVQEKANIYGIKSLETGELLELLTGKKLASYVVRELATQTIYQIGKELKLTPRKAAAVAAAIELGKRATQSMRLNLVIADSPGAAAAALSQVLAFSEVERFAVLVLDVKNRILGVEEITVGSRTETLAPPSEIFGRALVKGGTRIIVGHNHPSGSLEPSPEDLKLTEQLLAGGKLIDIPVLDHLILGNGDWVSLRQTTELWVGFPLA
jgi:DNA repair protein RadC